MREITVCAVCGGKNIDYKGQNIGYCHDCGREVETKDIYIATPYERTRARVYATGNRWAVENFNATH